MPFGGALIASAAIGGGSSIAGGYMGGKAAKSAAKIQADAATHAADLQNHQYEQSREDMAPWLDAGKISLKNLMEGVQPGGSLVTPYSETFHAPTAEEARNTPGYQFTKEEGEKGILNGNAAAGGAFTGGTLKELARYESGLADSTYGDTFNRALQDFNTRFNTYNTNQNNIYNRLASTAGLGQTAGVQLGQLGSQSAATQGSFLTNAGTAAASGVTGAANAMLYGLNGVANNASSYLRLNGMLNPYDYYGSKSGTDAMGENGLPLGVTPATYQG